MNLTRFAVGRRPVVLVAVLLALLAGIDSFLTMSRREDPEIKIRNCVIDTRWAGAPAQKVEELVTDAIEDAVYQLDTVKKVVSRSRTGVSVVNIELEDTVVEIEQAWDEVRAKVAQVQGALPAGCGTPYVNSNFGDVAAVCLALYQQPLPGRGELGYRYSPRELEDYAEALRSELKSLESVASVSIEGVQKERVTLEVDSRDWAKLGLTRGQLADLFQQRNIVAPGGSVATADGSYNVRPTGEIEELGELESLVVGMREDVVPVQLGDVAATLRRGYVDPPRNTLLFTNGEVTPDEVLLLAVTMKAGRNIVAMGAEIDAVVARLSAGQLPPDLGITRVNDLPRQVDTLVVGFVDNLIQAVVIVLLVAFLMMGWRPALIMAAAVPLCMVSSITVVKLLGVELEQFSIASLIIALGMVVDNAIVVSDNTLSLLRQGRNRVEAVIEGANGLAVPILTSTLTTVAAFAPMLTIAGGSGEYMRSLPIVVSVTLLISWVVAMAVTPLFCFWLLKAPAEPQAASDEGPKGLAKRYDNVVRWCMGHKLVTLGGATLAFVASLALVPLIGNQFFPGGHRDQFFVHVWMPDGAALEETEATAELVQERLLATRFTEVDGEQVDRLASALTFVGAGGPRMMLTMSPEDSNPNYAFMLVNTISPELSGDWADELRDACADLPGVRVDVRKFMLGPAVKYPVEFRLTGDDASVLRAAGKDMEAILRGVPGSLEVAQDWGNSGYEVEVEVDDDAVNLSGVTHAGVAATLNDLISGGYLTTLYEGDRSIDVVLRVEGDQRSGPADIRGLYVNGEAGKVPLDAVASVSTKWQPSLIRRVNNQRAISVGCQVMPDFLATSVSAEAEPLLRAFAAELPAGYNLEVRGEAYEAAKSSESIGGAMKISMLLIIFVLIVQYNSVLKPVIVLLSVPLAMIGALLGLYFSGWALGFMPMLGIVSLAGVVINNAIILIDFIEEGVAGGTPLRDAVARAGSARMKPIVLTTLTTVGGLLPLALFGGPMWAGMAYAMMGGLILSTALTLLVLPTMYVFFAENLRMQVLRQTL